MCTNEIQYATITTFMYPRCERARLSGYTPPLGHNPGGHTMGRWPKSHNKTSECGKQNRRCGLRAPPRGKRMGLRHYGIFRPNLRGRWGDSCNLGRVDFTQGERHQGVKAA